MSELVGRDVYLRLGSGPVQHFRAWDSKRFIEVQVRNGLEHTEGGKPAPYAVSVATAEEYRKQQRKARKR